MQDTLDVINNSVLDLQSATYQTYQRPLKALGRALSNEAFDQVNERLTADLDIEGFLKTAYDSQSGMIGSATLPWPDDDQEVLGLMLLLIQKFADDPDAMLSFGHTFISPGPKINDALRGVVREIIVPFARDYKLLAKGQTSPTRLNPPISSDAIFVVHGRDSLEKEQVARFIERIGYKPIILHEQANQGMTVIEKIERHSAVGFAIVLFTPDDEGRLAGEDSLNTRARQNVLIEMGYFVGSLGRSRVCILKKGAVEMPSDFAGAIWTDMDEAGAWKLDLSRELSAAGYRVDWNLVMGQ